MNMIVLEEHLGKSDARQAPTRREVETALEILRRHMDLGLDRGLGVETEDVLEAFGSRSTELNRTYPAEFVPTTAYKADMPDLQNGPESLIKGAKTEIQHVGISNFRLPLTFLTRKNSRILLETSVTGSVSLGAAKKGINMSRIMRSFYKHADEPFSFDHLSNVLNGYLNDLTSCDARVQLRIRYPMKKRSLRSGLEGFQYYDVAYEMLRQNSSETRIMHLDYVYSSTCPCSLELAEHARTRRGQIATPHSQRSVARLSLEVKDGQNIHIEDIVDMCTAAIPTETQVMVKREDEQAFAELNGSNPIFVEDAVRLLCQALESNHQIADFRVVASHQESLHSHDAVSILTKGETFSQKSYDPRLFESLYHAS